MNVDGVMLLKWDVRESVLSGGVLLLYFELGVIGGGLIFRFKWLLPRCLRDILCGCRMLGLCLENRPVLVNGVCLGVCLT